MHPSSPMGICVQRFRCCKESDIIHANLSLQCMDESKAPMMELRRKECMEWLEDYNECLHRDKEVSSQTVEH